MPVTEKIIGFVKLKDTMQEPSVLSDKQWANKGDIFNKMFYVRKNKLTIVIIIIWGNDLCYEISLTTVEE